MTEGIPDPDVRSPSTATVTAVCPATCSPDDWRKPCPPGCAVPAVPDPPCQCPPGCVSHECPRCGAEVTTP